MRKIILTTVFLAVAASAGAFTFTGLPWDAAQPYVETGGRNYLPWNASDLENKHGIRVFVYKFPAVTKIDSEKMAAAYYDTITKTPEDKIILIWADKKQNDGVIMASDSLKKILPEDTLELLQKEVLRPYINKWYVGEARLYSKILGTVVYVLEKPANEATETEETRAKYIKLDDPLYRISLKQPFYDLLSLFFFEPVTFCLYFPFVMYAFMVRLLGMHSGKKVFILMNALWLGLTGFIFALILNRFNIIFPEYVRLFSFFMGLNLPLYMAFFLIYQDRVEAAAYSYLYNVTGGFSSGGSFGDIK
jgi:hypothetical protein